MKTDDLALEIAQLKQSHRRMKLLATTGAILAGCTLLVAAKAPDRTAKFETIDAQRINIREPDGTIRLTISNKASFPGAYIKNKEIQHPRDMEGVLFFNDEGTENGGLIFNGRLSKDGKPSSGVSLTFDRYEQDQQMQLLGIDEAGKHFAGLTFNDVPDGLKYPVFSKEAKQQYGARRVYLGKAPSQNSTLQLYDAMGKARLELTVTPSGEAKIVFLDANGKRTREISGEN